MFLFEAPLAPRVRSVNAAVVGIVDGEEVFLHRYSDALALRIHPGIDRMTTGPEEAVAGPEVDSGAGASATDVHVLASE